MISSERYKYLLKHVAISFCIIVLIAYLLYRVWYPNAISSLMGINKVFILLAVALIFIWPMFTALVIKKNKNEQRRDHAILWMLQIFITIVAVYFLFITRPVWIVFSADLFEIVRYKDIIYSENSSIPHEGNLSIFGSPKWLGASFSEDKALAVKQRTGDLEGISLARRVDGLVSLSDKQELLSRHLHSMDELKKFNKEDEIQKILEKYPQATAWLPIKGFIRDGIVITDKSFSFFQVVLLQPWEKDL